MINEETTIEEIVKTEKGKKILAKYGVPCLSCPMASKEIKFLKIGDVADMYGLEKEKMIKELNKK
jgi:hypothetical protein